MAASIVLHLEQAGTYPGYLYLPGEDVPNLDGYDGTDPTRDTACAFCAEPIGWQGTDDPSTGRKVRQYPAQGRHDGIVSGVYAPVAGVRRMESDFSHLRCVLDAIDGGGVGTLTVAPCDPYTVPLADEAPGRHAA